MVDIKKNAPETEGKEAKVGVYICYCGGNISDHVDVEKVRERMERVPGVAVARTNMFMCSDPGQELIMEDLKTGAIDSVVVASCAPSLHETTFRAAIARAGGNPYKYEHANIREQVSWVHHGDPATDKATRLVAAATGKARFLKPLEPIRVQAHRCAVVIGGGVAGMRAALDLAAQGIETHIVEKSPYLGGGAAALGRLAPTGEDAAKLVEDLALRVLKHPFIEVYAAAEVSGFGGYVGNFSVECSGHSEQSSNAHEQVGRFIPGKGVGAPQLPRPKKIQIEAGVIVLATGYASYTPRVGEYGYGEHPEVVTLPEFTRLLAEATEEGRTLTINGRTIRRLGIIHCVGSRQIPGIHEEREDGTMNEYCSRVCCAASINAANTVRESFPDTNVYELYRDIRTYGRGQEEMYARASANKVVFMRFADEEARRCEAMKTARTSP